MGKDEKDFIKGASQDIKKFNILDVIKPELVSKLPRFKHTPSPYLVNDISKPKQSQIYFPQQIFDTVDQHLAKLNPGAQELIPSLRKHFVQYAILKLLEEEQQFALKELEKL